MGEKTYYSMDPMGKLKCHKCKKELVRGGRFSAISAMRSR